MSDRPYWCEICARKKECYGITLKPKCFVADRKTENCSEKPNNCEWSVEYAKEMLNTMPCEDCGHWEHGAGDHYYCALLAMRQECCFESKDESTLMFANTPKTEPQTDGILFKGNLKEGDYKLIKTTDGWVLEGEDIVYCGWERKDE